MKQHWDIFCKIVDNLGDIGVCWRLAKQLHNEYGLNVRLWIDDLATAKKIIPHLNVDIKQQAIDDIIILKWPNSNEETKIDFTDVADVVIELQPIRRSRRGIHRTGRRRRRNRGGDADLSQSGL